MKRYLAAFAACSLMTVAAWAAVNPPRELDAAADSATRARSANRTSAGVHLFAFGTRSAQQRESLASRKLDAVLAELARHATLARPGHELSDLHSLSPAVHFRLSATDASPLVLVDAVTTGDPRKLEAALLARGMQNAALYSNDVSGWLPLRELDAATALSEVHSIRAAMSRTRAGAVTSQGDFAQRSNLIRSTYPSLTGAGVTVGVISDSFNCYAVYAKNNVPASGPAGYASNGFLADAAKDMATGDLPGSVQLVSTPPQPPATQPNPGEFPCLSYGAPTQLPFTDEGRAMMQIVHDVAPGASLSFHSAEYGEADFAQGIRALAAAGAKVIADDVGYFDEPFFQDGILSQAIDAVKAQGVAYFSAAGNNGQFSWESSTPSFATLSASPPTAGEHLLNFDTTSASTSPALPVSIPSLSQGEIVAIVLEWDQPYVTGAPASGGATSQLDLCVSGSGSDLITDIHGNSTTCTGPNALHMDPVQVLIISNPANAASATPAETVNIVVGLAAGSSPPGTVKVVIEAGGAPVVIQKFATSSPTLQGHPGAAGAAAVGAASFYATPPCGVSPAQLHSYSSRGGDPILFDSSGTRLAAPIHRQKPDFVGPDGVNDTFLGFTLASAGVQDTSPVQQCANNPAYPNFFGTSAATPHAAGAAALMMQANPAVTPDLIYAAIRNTADFMPDGANSDGSGFIKADAALAQLPPAAPTLSLAAMSVAAGTTTTLTWTSVNTTGCTASGAWTGNQPSSGSQMITAPSTAGTATYTLTCSNAAGSATRSINLTVTGSSGSGGGGGALDGLTVLMLASLAIGRRSSARKLRSARLRHFDGHV